MVYNNNKLHSIINVKAIIIHVIAYALFLASQMYLYFTTLRQLKEGKDVSPKKFGISINLKTLFLTLSEMCMCYAFWEIYKMNGGNPDEIEEAEN